MSSTIVHSKSEDSNKYCASAQIIPTTPEKGLDIPPKNSKPGPTRYSIKSEELVLEISSVGNYTVQKDGTVINTKSGEELGKVSLQECNTNREIRVRRAPSKYAQRKDKGMEI